MKKILIVVLCFILTLGIGISILCISSNASSNTDSSKYISYDSYHSSLVSSNGYYFKLDCSSLFNSSVYENFSNYLTNYFNIDYSIYSNLSGDDLNQSSSSMGVFSNSLIYDISNDYNCPDIFYYYFDGYNANLSSLTDFYINFDISYPVLKYDSSFVSFETTPQHAWIYLLDLHFSIHPNNYNSLSNCFYFELGSNYNTLTYSDLLTTGYISNSNDLSDFKSIYQVLIQDKFLFDSFNLEYGINEVPFVNNSNIYNEYMDLLSEVIPNDLPLNVNGINVLNSQNVNSIPNSSLIDISYPLNFRISNNQVSLVNQNVVYFEVKTNLSSQYRKYYLDIYSLSYNSNTKMISISYRIRFLTPSGISAIYTSDSTSIATFSPNEKYPINNNNTGVITTDFHYVLSKSQDVWALDYYINRYPYYNRSEYISEFNSLTSKYKHYSLLAGSYTDVNIISNLDFSFTGNITTKEFNNVGYIQIAKSVSTDINGQVDFISETRNYSQYNYPLSNTKLVSSVFESFFAIPLGSISLGGNNYNFTLGTLLLFILGLSAFALIVKYLAKSL